MKSFKRIGKVAIAGGLVALLAFSAVGCSGSGGATGGGGKEKIDVVLWNASQERFPDVSGATLMNFAANQYSVKTGIDVNIITISANTQEEFNTKRNALLLEEDSPEIVMFTSREENDFINLSNLEDTLLETEEYLENRDDILKGFVSEHLVGVACRPIANAVNNKIADLYLPNYKKMVISDKEFKAGYLKWAKESGEPLNLLDLDTFIYDDTNQFTAIENNTLVVDSQLMIEAIKQNDQFIKSMPSNQPLEGEVGIKYLGLMDEAMFRKDFSDFKNSSDKHIMKTYSGNRSNVLDVIELGQNCTKTETPLLVAEKPEISFIGLGVVANESKEQEDAIQFVKYLLSSEFQSELPTAVTTSGSMNGSVLRSVNENQIERAKKARNFS